jgi:hypothetical protein
MLLNEFLKEHQTVAELQQEIATLTGTVKAQTAQIQTFSERIEVSKPVSQMALNNDN